MSWPLIKLSDCCEIIMGQAPVGSSYNEKREGHALIAGAGDFGELTPKPKKHTTAASKLSKKDDLILCIRATIGDLNWSNDEYCLGRGVAGLRPEEILDKDYLWYFIKANKEQLASKGTGSTFKQVSRLIISDWEIPLPPLDEQKRIAAILDKADAIRRKRQQAIQLADDFLRSVFLDMFGDPVTNPKGWEVKTLGEITYKVTDGTHKTPTYTESGIPFLSAKNIKPYGLDWTVTKFISASEHAQLIKRCNPEPGDILLSKSGSLGTPAIVNTTKDFSLFESAALIKLKKEFIHPLFLVHFMKSKPGQNLMLRSTKGVAIKHLHLTDLRELKVIIPSIEHQGRFTRIVESLEVTISKMANKQHSPDDMFNSLSQKAFAGEL